MKSLQMRPGPRNLIFVVLLVSFTACALPGSFLEFVLGNLGSDKQLPLFSSLSNFDVPLYSVFG